jgi:hypothetical protein
MGIRSHSPDISTEPHFIYGIEGSFLARVFHGEEVSGTVFEVRTASDMKWILVTMPPQFSLVDSDRASDR